MKRLIIVPALLSLNMAFAQTDAGITHNQWEENNTRHKTMATPANEFVDMEMSLSGNTLTFSGIPNVRHAVYAILTNAEGEYIKQAKISADQNAMELKKMRGGLYFVTIMYRNQSKKAFTLNL